MHLACDLWWLHNLNSNDVELLDISVIVNQLAKHRAAPPSKPGVSHNASYSSVAAIYTRVWLVICSPSALAFRLAGLGGPR